MATVNGGPNRLWILRYSDTDPSRVARQIEAAGGTIRYELRSIAAIACSHPYDLSPAEMLAWDGVKDAEEDLPTDSLCGAGEV